MLVPYILAFLLLFTACSDHHAKSGDNTETPNTPTACSMAPYGIGLDSGQVKVLGIDYQNSTSQILGTFTGASGHTMGNRPFLDRTGGSQHLYYVSNSNLYRYDLTTNLSSEIVHGLPPEIGNALIVGLDSQRGLIGAYSNAGSWSVKRFDLATSTVTDLGALPNTMAMTTGYSRTNCEGTMAYFVGITNTTVPVITEVNLQNGTIRQVDGAGSPAAIVYEEDYAVIVSSNGTDGTLKTVDFSGVATTIVGSLVFPGFSGWSGVSSYDPVDQHLYIIGGSNALFSFDTNTNTFSGKTTITGPAIMETAL